jgi:predicted DsbA family dithiol-disulfide isomerase
MTRSIAVTFDYRCPFAYNGNAAAVNAVRAGADLDVRYLAFSLDQVHVEEGAPAVWDLEPDARGSGVLALQYGLAVRDAFPEHFDDAHLALFAARHEHGRKIDQESVLRDVIASVGLDPDDVATEVESGRPLKTLATEHTEAVDRWGVWGVPTFIDGDDAAFVRFMERGRVDDLDRMLDLLTWTRLNEFKRPSVAR